VTYAVKLDVFEGPLDLLLHLISKERVNVADITISDVTEEYLRATAALGEVDLETASSFLILAATLLELKSLKLLPSRSTVDPELRLLLEERDRLLHRLVVYSTFKKVAVRLERRMAENVGFHSRSAELPEELIPAAPDIFRDLTPEKLAQAAVRALTPPDRPTVDTSHITRITVSLEEMVEKLRTRLSREKSGSFRGICSTAQSRIEVVIALLAVLELFKTQTVDLEQETPFGEIGITYRSRESGAA
jgi:segregation and condensation protein A